MEKNFKNTRWGINLFKLYLLRYKIFIKAMKLYLTRYKKMKQGITFTKAEIEILQNLISSDIQIFYDDRTCFKSYTEAYDYITNLLVLSEKFNMSVKQICEDEFIDPREFHDILKEILKGKEKEDEKNKNSRHNTSSI